MRTVIALTLAAVTLGCSPAPRPIIRQKASVGGVNVQGNGVHVRVDGRTVRIDGAVERVIVNGKVK
ncbi:hypothetical protein U8335_02255 [Roseiconus lacunae]|uniref:hypothetical protein n=1 Tax=Roseiconus lacunae TaxID=2605694 RepID=UPI003087B346|nr:hypothetical protein U8335_02255 [Stieleria sp. HD01]